MTDAKTFDVSILGKSYRVSCSDDERDELLEAVAYLDRRMREIRESGKVIGGERIAVMAALNIAHELLTTRLGAGFDLGEFKRRIGRMQEAIDRALAEQDELF
ncbi:MAG TPA: cell division protein ZapA [Burkholderiales bacterium]